MLPVLSRVELEKQVEEMLAGISRKPMAKSAASKRAAEERAGKERARVQRLQAEEEQKVRAKEMRRQEAERALRRARSKALAPRPSPKKTLPGASPAKAGGTKGVSVVL